MSNKNSNLPLRVVTVGFAALAVAGNAQAAKVTPHRAIYEISLASARSSELAGVSGRMMFEWADACDGWIVEQRYALRFLYSDGQESQRTVSHVSWEAKDGLSYRYFITRHQDGSLETEIRGQAELKGRGLGGTAMQTHPTEQTIPLPSGTIFPTAHTLELIDRAEAGEGIYYALLFDGGEDAAGGVSAVIGEASGPASGAIRSELLDTSAWGVNLAFFPSDEQTAAPDYEMRFDQLANGVVRNVVIDYDDFALEFSVSRIEPLPAAGC